jgi:DNA-binding IclR family transcriptional regulator
MGRLVAVCWVIAELEGTRWMSSNQSSDKGRGEGSPGAIDRALDLFAIAVNAGGPMTLAEAASQAGLSKPTAHRILQTLVSHRLLRQDENRSYRLGPEAYSLSGKALSQMEYAREARAGLDWLQEVTPETIHFGALSGDVPVYVAKVEGRRPYRMASTLGTQLPMHCTAIGKCVLAFLSSERAAPFLTASRLTRQTAHTITKVGELKAQLEEIRERGYSIDDEENEDNIRCVGAPVFGAGGEIVGGLAVSAPTFHLSLSEAHALAPATMAAAAKISSALGAPLTAIPRSAAG